MVLPPANRTYSLIAKTTPEVVLETLAETAIGLRFAVRRTSDRATIEVRKGSCLSSLWGQELFGGFCRFQAQALDGPAGTQLIVAFNQNLWTGLFGMRATRHAARTLVSRTAEALADRGIRVIATDTDE